MNRFRRTTELVFSFRRCRSTECEIGDRCSSSSTSVRNLVFLRSVSYLIGDRNPTFFAAFRFFYDCYRS